MDILIVTLKEWNIKRAKFYRKIFSNFITTHIITKKEDLTINNIEKIKPDYIFFVHWSYYINEAIFNNYMCIGFHTGDLPYGKGGSPIQNLISRKIYKTKISAFKVSKNLDSGEILMKYPIKLNGSCYEILDNISRIIFTEMIPRITSGRYILTKQEGRELSFKRRTPEESEIKSDYSLIDIYDYIRMLDCPGYPSAFLKFGTFKLSFKNAKIKGGKIFTDCIVERSKD